MDNEWPDWKYPGGNLPCPGMRIVRGAICKSEVTGWKIF